MIKTSVIVVVMKYDKNKSNMMINKEKIKAFSVDYIIVRVLYSGALQFWLTAVMECLPPIPLLGELGLAIQCKNQLWTDSF